MHIVFLKNIIKMTLICTKYMHDIFTVTMCIKISLKYYPNIDLNMNCLIFWIIVYIIKIDDLKRLNPMHFRFLPAAIWMHLLWTRSILDSFPFPTSSPYSMLAWTFAQASMQWFIYFYFLFPFLFLMNNKKISHFCNSQRKCKNLSTKLRHQILHFVNIITLIVISPSKLHWISWFRHKDYCFLDLPSSADYIYLCDLMIIIA